MKDGYYIAVRNNGTDRPIKIRRSSRSQIDEAIEQYNKVKEVEYLGRVVDGKFVPEEAK